MELGSTVTTAVADYERRRNKTDRLRAGGIDPFPTYEPSGRSLIAEVLRTAGPPSSVKPTERESWLAGRVIARRRRGSTTFLELRDRSGTIRLCVRGEAPDGDREAESDRAGDCAWDIGDIVTVTGSARRLASGEVGLDVSSGALLAKAMRIHHGLSQAEHRTRLAELALMESPDRRERTVARARIVTAIRAWMDQHDFVEVETPTLQPRSAGGGLARQFHTRHKALDRDASLRTSSELHLRRCTVGDLERVYELGRCFRNEGMSARHRPEFTMLEWSMAYSNYRDSAAQVESIVDHLAGSVLDTPEVSFRGEHIDLRAPWRRVSLRDAVHERTGIDILEEPEQSLSRYAENGSSPRSWSEAVHRLYA